MKTLDWAKLEAFIAERNPVEVSAGILDDWFWTAATVWEKGEWKEKDRAFVTSSWGSPGFKAEMPNGDLIEVAASVDETPEQEAHRKALSEKSREELKGIAARLEAHKD